MHNFEYKAFIAIGSNKLSQGSSPLDVVLVAIQKMASILNHKNDNILKVSRFYTTPAFPADSGADFVNVVVSVSVDCSAHDVLQTLHDIENELGRERNLRWGERVIDLDLLSVGDQILPSAAVYRLWKDLPFEAQKSETPEELILPHPRIQDRGFVLVPLCDIDENWRHPYLASTARTLCDALPAGQRKDVRVIKDTKIKDFFRKNPGIFPCNP